MATKPGTLIVIVGQTASGKSALAMELAQQFNGEIICADARTIYQGMDIGTAKPTAAERKLVPHHLVDVVTPDQRFSAADFKNQAVVAISDITKRGKLPIMVGGTGLYVDAVLYDFDFREPADPALRAELEAMSVEQLQDRLSSLGLPLPANQRNPRHLIRSIETNGEVAQRKPLRANTLIIGLEVDRPVLRNRIYGRVNQMLQQGLEREVEGLLDNYGPEAPGLNAIGYREWRQADEPAELIIKNTLAYAKRQKTWFKRNKSIHWVGRAEQAVAIATTFLNKTRP